MRLLSRRARRLGAGTTLTAAVAALVFAAGVAPAQAAPEVAVISNATLTIVYEADVRKVRLEFDVSFTDPVNGSGGVYLNYSGLESCSVSGSGGGIQRIFTGNSHYSETFLTGSLVGYQTFTILPWDLDKNEIEPFTTVTAGDPLTAGDEPTAVVSVDPSGTSGVVSVTTGYQLPVYGVAYGTGETPGTVGGAPACTTTDFPFSGLGSGERFSVVSTDLDGLVLAEYTAPVVAPAAVLPPTGAPVALPLGAGVLLLLGGASIVAVAAVRNNRRESIR